MTLGVQAETPHVHGHAVKYRPEIDGLRSIAVLVVVVFHAKLGFFSGGFVGVDVFFVISGFLISSLILRDIKASNFKVLDFMERRIRRIMPALVVTVAVTLVAGWYLYLPEDFERLARAVKSQAQFTSNLFHRRISNYFGPQAEDLPLLHTWSLAVEEQFYILFPVVLLAVGAWQRRWLNLVIVLLGVFSLGLAVWSVPHYQRDAFYFLPHRAWELLLGALLAAYPAWGNKAARWLRETVSWGGLLAMIVSVVWFDSETPFPGAAALLPCLGAAGFIWANRVDCTAGGRLLSRRPFVFVGQVSYSFYLVHWPVLVFSTYWFREELTWWPRFGLMVMAFLLSVLSWLVVETPVRKKRVLAERRTLFLVGACSMLVLVGWAQFVQHERGFPSRFGAQALKYAEARNHYAFRSEMDLKSVQSGNFTKLGAPDGPVKCLIWGDSHAMAMASALDGLCREKGYRGFAAMHSSTAPLVDFVSAGRYSLKDESGKFAEAVIKFAVEQNVQTVILIARWSNYAGDPAFDRSLNQTLSRLGSAGLKTVIVRDVPTQAGDVPWLLAKASKLGRDVNTVGVPLEQHREKNKAADQIFATLRPTEVTLLDPIPYLVDEKGLCRAEYDNESMYFDVHHLSLAGARRLRPMFEPILR